MIDKLKIKKHETLFVGDTIADAQAGLGAGIRTILVRTGPYSMEVIKQGLVHDCDILQSVKYIPNWFSKVKPKLVAHHDDSPCCKRLNPDGFCPECNLYSDTQSKSLWYYCPTCDLELENMICSGCKWVFIRPNF